MSTSIRDSSTDYTDSINKICVICGYSRETLEAFPNEIRRLDKERARVATEAGDDLGCERMGTGIVQIIVVTGVERGAGTRRPAKQRLRTQSRIQCVVVEDQPRERGFGELIRAPQSHDVDLVRNQTGVVSPQPLMVDTERRAQLEIGRAHV